MGAQFVFDVYTILLDGTSNNEQNPMIVPVSHQGDTLRWMYCVITAGNCTSLPLAIMSALVQGM